jgi:hypothetical protein
LRIYLDPGTGRPRAPTDEELANELTERAQSAANASSVRSAASAKGAPGARVTELPGGLKEFDFGEAAQVQETVCVQADGRLGECTAAQKAELTQHKSAGSRGR